MKDILEVRVTAKVDAIVTHAKETLKNLLETDINFAFNLLAKIPEFENANPGKLVGLANLNPGAALGILSNPTLQNIIPQVDAEIIFANLLNNSRDKKVTEILRTYVINLLNADAAAPAFRAAQLQAFFNHPSRLAEEFKIPTVLLEQYWDQGNFEKTPENRDKFLATHDRNHPNNPRKKHWFRNLFAGRDNAFFKNLYQQLVVEIKPLGAEARALPLPSPAVHAEENSDDHESSISRDHESAKRAKPIASASMNIESEATKVDVAIPGDAVFQKLQEQLAAVIAQRNATKEAAPPIANYSPAKITASLQQAPATEKKSVRRPLTPEFLRPAGKVDAIEKSSLLAKRTHSVGSLPVDRSEFPSTAKPGQKH